MPFIKIEGFTGNIYVPETNQGRKKHQCRDCYQCQYCSDERCELCLRNSKNSPQSVKNKNKDQQSQ